VIELGKQYRLNVLRQTNDGLILVDDQKEEILLPTNEFSGNFKIGDSLNVFIYRDQNEKKIATTVIPKIWLHEFALLQVASITKVGAFLNWGLNKDLLIPFSEQQQELKEGRWYIVYLDIDETTDRLFGSTYIERQLQNIHITVKEGEKVDLLVYQKTDLGYSVIVNNEHKGLVFENEIFTTINIGDFIKGYVKKIREDNKLDISLQPIGYKKFIDVNSSIIYSKLYESNGYLAVTDKSSPEEIKSLFGLSKKAFKKSIGALYKQKKIMIEKDGIRILN
jgi:hypothetical protein